MARRLAIASTTKVLIVDDDDAFRRSIQRTLAEHGYSCIEAANSAQARILLHSERDVAGVVCDIKMPDSSGIELLTELTADFPDLAVVMTTGVDDPRIAEMAFDFGAFGYLIKPFETNELLVNLAGALKRRQLESAQRGHVRTLEQIIARTRILGAVLEGLEGGPGASLDGEEEMIERLTRAVSLHDEETGQHIERMSRYAVVLAGAVDFTRLSPKDLRLAMALHDVGKIGVPDGILLKPGSLSLDEHAAVQRHAQIGYQLLAGSTSELLRAAADIALTHHEWWDGGGYPQGLRGTDIPEAARIAAVTDVFDALTSDRPHRPRLSFDDAIAVMRQLRGRQFEPRLLDAFFARLDEIALIRDAYPDEQGALKCIRVLVVDGHEASLRGLVRVLEGSPQLRVVGTAGSVSEAVVATLAYQPDVILMDFDLPDGDGPQATGQIKALTPSVKVIMLTGGTNDQDLVRAIGAGCSGFVGREETVDKLREAIVVAHEGETVPSASELAPLLRQLGPTHRGLGSDLTPRELEILEEIASGLVNKQIARRLGLSLNTVRNHARNILQKLGAHSKLEAVATAVREGIIDYPGEARDADAAQASRANGG